MKEELLALLKEHLRVEMEDDGDYLTVKILLDDEVVSEASERIYRN
jgi:hypothetical protein